MRGLPAQLRLWGNLGAKWRGLRRRHDPSGNQSVPQGQATAMWLLRLDLLRVKGMKTFATLGEYRRSDSEQ
jgi:hypothetical protein